MQLSKVVLKGFRCFPFDPATVIDIDTPLTTLVGPNGAGKTSVLLALTRMFGAFGKGRGISRPDFYVPPEEKQGERPDKRELVIEAWFDLSEYSTDDAVHDAGAHLLAEIGYQSGKGLQVRIRLEAEWIADGSADGQIEERIFSVDSLIDTPGHREKQVLRKSTRSKFHVHYIAANRDPSQELGTAASALLGRLLAAVRWQNTEQVQEALQTASNAISSEKAVTDIKTALQASWGALNKTAIHQTLDIQFAPQELKSLIRQASVVLAPTENGETIPANRLGDGHRSLLHLSTLELAYRFQRLLTTYPRPTPDPWNLRKLPVPCFTLFALEEPENHLAPHLLGRVVRQLNSFTSNETSTQAVITSHSPALVSRVDPSTIRYLRQTKGASEAKRLHLPAKDVAAEKLIAGTIRAYPEMFFAGAVVLGEGDSERLVLPRVIATHAAQGSQQAKHAASITGLDDLSVSVIPIGGRHINHWWRLLHELGIPCLTLLDLDEGRFHGGPQQILYVLDQMSLWHSSPEARSWAAETKKSVDIEQESSWRPVILKLRDYKIFFSEPLDLDYSMLYHFPAAYKMIASREQGPPEGDTPAEIDKEVFHNSGRRTPTYQNHDDHLNWYRYRFLGKRGKPATHLAALAIIEESTGWKSNVPPELIALADAVHATIGVQEAGLPLVRQMDESDFEEEALSDP